MVECRGRIPLAGHDARIVVEIQEHFRRALALEFVEVAPDLVGGPLQGPTDVDSVRPQPHHSTYDEAKRVRVASGLGGGRPYDVDRAADRREVRTTAADPAVGDPTGPPQRHVSHATQ